MKETSKSMLKKKNKAIIEDMATWQQTAYLVKPQPKTSDNPYTNKQEQQITKAIEIPLINEAKSSPYKTIIKVGSKKRQIYRGHNRGSESSINPIAACNFESEVNSQNGDSVLELNHTPVAQPVSNIQ